MRQYKYVDKFNRLHSVIEYNDFEPCSHPGCLNHKTHPCELCKRIAGKGKAVLDSIILIPNKEDKNKNIITKKSIEDVIKKIEDTRI